jgi:hypothetical protein
VKKFNTRLKAMQIESGLEKWGTFYK